MENLTVTWEDFEVYRFTDFNFTQEKGYKAYSVELKNKEVISIQSFISRVKQHINENNHQFLYDALVEYWTKNPNGDHPKFAAYISYANKSFNMPTWAGFDDFKKRGLYLEELGDIYPWPTN